MIARALRIEVVNFHFTRDRTRPDPHELWRLNALHLPPRVYWRTALSHSGDRWLAVTPSGAPSRRNGLCQCATCVSPAMAVRAERARRS